MTPLTVNPTVVIRINTDTNDILSVASNIDPELKIVLVDNSTDFIREAANKPFDSTRPLQPTN